jgi:hypothetical protein
MTNLTMAVPEDLHNIMQRHKDVKWSEVARQAMWEKARKLDLMEKILAKSELKESDIDALDKKIKKGIAKRHELK